MTTPQNRSSFSNAFPDRFHSGSGSILAAQMGPKTKPEAGQDPLSDVYQSQNEKKKVSASFVPALSTLRRCNLIVKTLVFLNVFISSLLFRFLSILVRGDFKKGFTIDFYKPKPFQNAVRSYLRLGNASGTGLERFWTPKWSPKRSL